ncbi:hypothetical protein JOD51_002725 [Curtobacterium herbarum]|nr:hypothetical protein [Curtobacterium herbarum]
MRWLEVRPPGASGRNTRVGAPRASQICPFDPRRASAARERAEHRGRSTSGRADLPVRSAPSVRRTRAGGTPGPDERTDRTSARSPVRVSSPAAPPPSGRNTRALPGLEACFRPPADARPSRHRRPGQRASGRSPPPPARPGRTFPPTRRRPPVRAPPPRPASGRKTRVASAQRTRNRPLDAGRASRPGPAWRGSARDAASGWNPPARATREARSRPLAALRPPRRRLAGRASRERAEDPGAADASGALPPARQPRRPTRTARHPEPSDSRTPRHRDAQTPRDRQGTRTRRSPGPSCEGPGLRW